MPSLAETIARLSSTRTAGLHSPGTSRLQAVGRFGDNPGGLTMKAHVPDGLGKRSPLVVVLHGCTQNAASYDHGSGWSALADELGFALLYPEQQRANNPNLCFNWFQQGDVARGSGEVASIREMIATMVLTYDLDPKRVFITGLSAGGAMTAAMLAAYPEVFAGGAIIAGLAAGLAVSVPEALQQMRSPNTAAARAVPGASSHRGPWPIVSVWHGDHDQTVAAANAEIIVAQWRDIHGVSIAGQSEMVDGHRRTVWRDSTGREVIEEYSISGMGHGVPLTTTGPDALGAAAPYMLDVGISSTRNIARFFGLAGARRSATVKPAKQIALAGKLSEPIRVPPPAPSGPGAVIENALRAAGLMR